MKKLIIISISLLLLTACFSNKEEKLGGYSPTQNLVISSGAGIEIYTGAGVSPSIVISSGGIITLGSGTDVNIANNRISFNDIYALKIIDTDGTAAITCNTLCNNDTSICLGRFISATGTGATNMTTQCGASNAGIFNTCVCFGKK